MTGTPVCVVDAFTNTPFTGNPAAVCRVDVRVRARHPLPVVPSGGEERVVSS